MTNVREALAHLVALHRALTAEYFDADYLDNTEGNKERKAHILRELQKIDMEIYAFQTANGDAPGSLLDREPSAAKCEEIKRLKELRPRRKITQDILIAAYQEGYFTREALYKRAERAFRPFWPGDRQMMLGYVVEKALSIEPKKLSKQDRAKQGPQGPKPFPPAILDLVSKLLWLVMQYETDANGEKLSREEANVRVLKILRHEFGFIITGIHTIEDLKPKEPTGANSK